VGAAILNKFSRLGYWPAVNLTACQPACGVCDIAIAVTVDGGDRDDDAMRRREQCVAVDARHFAVFDGDTTRCDAPRRVRYGSFLIPRNGIREYARYRRERHAETRPQPAITVKHGAHRDPDGNTCVCPSANSR